MKYFLIILSINLGISYSSEGKGHDMFLEKHSPPTDYPVKRSKKRNSLKAIPIPEAITLQSEVEKPSPKKKRSPRRAASETSLPVSHMNQLYSILENKMSPCKKPSPRLHASMSNLEFRQYKSEPSANTLMKRTSSEDVLLRHVIEKNTIKTVKDFLTNKAAISEETEEGNKNSPIAQKKNNSD